MTKKIRPHIGQRSPNPVGPTDPTGAHHWRRSLPLFTAGGASVVAGGMAAAVTGPMQWGHGSWVAAFLVLVAGAAQIGIGAG